MAAVSRMPARFPWSPAILPNRVRPPRIWANTNTPSTGNWQSYVWAPVINSGGTPARFVADGTVKTLRYTFDGAGDNVGFLMLLPADSA